MNLPLSISLSLSCSGLSAGIYATNGPDACHFVLEDSKSNVVIVENQSNWIKFCRSKN